MNNCLDRADVRAPHAKLRDRNSGSFESARSGFADYVRDGETVKELRARVNRTILEDLEEKVMALRALHTKLRNLEAEENLGGYVARNQPA